MLRVPETNWICYADLNKDGEFISTGIHYGTGSAQLKSQKLPQKGLKEHSGFISEKIQEKRLQLGLNKSFANNQISLKSVSPSFDGEYRTSLGKVRGITILIDFEDEVATIPKSEIRDMLNKQGYTGYGNNGSVFDYFYDMSEGKLELTQHVVGYYRAPKPKSYYDNPELEGYDNVDELLRDILNEVDRDFFFNQYTSLGFYLVSVNFMYAGNPEAGWGKGLWPHSGFLGKSVDNVGVGFYQLSRITDDLKIGTFCHETGHSVLRLPDLYDYGSDSRGVGRYDIMGSVSDKNPPPLNAFFRDLCGWENVVDITRNKNMVSYNLIANSNNSLVYRHPFIQNESFYIEARQKKGRNDWLPDEGVLIWHIDYRGSNDYEHRTWYKHYYASVVQADGQYDLENNRNSGDEDDLFDSVNQLFTRTSTPSSVWWDGSPSGLRMLAVSNIADTMVVSFNSDETEPFMPLELSAPVNGLQMNVIEGDFTRMPSFNDFSLARQGLVSDLGVNLAGFNENYAIQFKGYIKAPVSGMYEFSLSSDDGSIMYLNDRVVVHNSNDLHGNSSNAEVYLQKGFYKFQMDYFQYEINRGMELKWKVPDGLLTKVPDNVFYVEQSALNLSIPEKENMFYFDRETRTLHFNSQTDLEYAIYALNGKIVLAGKQSSGKSDQLLLPNGVYILTLKNKVNRFSHKLIIQ